MIPRKDRVVIAPGVAEKHGSGYGKLDRGNGGGKPTFSDGQRGGFVNRSIIPPSVAGSSCGIAPASSASR